jgi:ectoine hydroxylase-related dioxygenase (phytanoyl-CoA dioxygenase family)
MAQLTVENTDQPVVQVQDGTLLFFPAWLPHSVDANSSDQPRISVSCNVMFRGYTETMSKPPGREAHRVARAPRPQPSVY